MGSFFLRDIASSAGTMTSRWRPSTGRPDGNSLSYMCTPRAIATRRCQPAHHRLALRTPQRTIRTPLTLSNGTNFSGSMPPQHGFPPLCPATPMSSRRRTPPQDRPDIQELLDEFATFPGLSMESVRQDVERASRLRFANEENKRAELGATLGSVGTMAHLGATQHWANSRDIYKSLMPKTPCTPRQATGQPRRLLPEYTLTPAQRSIQLNDSFRCVHLPFDALTPAMVCLLSFSLAYDCVYS